MLGWSFHSHSSRIVLAIHIIILVIVYQKAKNIRNNSFRGVALFGAMLNRTAKKDYVTYMDIQGIEPWTSRMRSVRATTVPNARHAGFRSKIHSRNALESYCFDRRSFH